MMVKCNKVSDACKDTGCPHQVPHHVHAPNQTGWDGDSVCIEPDVCGVVQSDEWDVKCVEVEE